MSASSIISSPKLTSPVGSVGITLTFKVPYYPLSPTIDTLEGLSIKYPKLNNFKYASPINYYSGGSQNGSSPLESMGISLVSKYLSSRSFIM